MPTLERTLSTRLFKEALISVFGAYIGTLKLTAEVLGQMATATSNYISNRTGYYVEVEIHWFPNTRTMSWIMTLEDGLTKTYTITFR